jgi:hypothetical protein
MMPGLGASAKFLVNALQRVSGAQGFPLRWGKLQKGEQLIACFFE